MFAEPPSPDPVAAISTRRGSALPRLPVLLAAMLVVAGVYAVTAIRLKPALFPGAREEKQTSLRDSTELANLRAVEAILSAMQQALRDGEMDKAKTIIDRAVERFPRDQALWLARADLRYRLAYPADDTEVPEAERNGYLAEAYDSYTRALSIGPRTPEMEFSAGSIARDLGKLDAAEAHFQMAAQGDRSKAAYPLNLAQVYLTRNELDRAKAQLAVSVALDADQPNAWGMLAEVALRQDEPRIALQHLEKAVRLEPAEPAWRHMQARAFNRIAEPQRALESLEALPQADRFARVSLQLAGQSYGLLHRPESALALYEEALRSGVADPEVMLDAAVWAERLGDRRRALELATRARAQGLQRADEFIERLNAGTPTGG
ncbi:MAG: hypothetical protein Kow0022_04510 [Phycisphaerales bacterium]